MRNDEIPEDYLVENERNLMLAKPEKLATLDLIKRFPDVAVYGLLLTHDPKHPLSQLVRERWTELHHLTGQKFLLVAFQPPDEWSDHLKNFWKKQLGDSYEQTWQDWQKGLDFGVAYDYLDLFENPIKLSQLPCLVLFTDLEERKAVVRSIPNWDSDSLFKLITGMLESISKCYEQRQEERLDCLKNSLTSPSTRTLTQLAHMQDQVIDYFKKNPAQPVTITVSLVLALATANVLPLSIPMAFFLKAVKDIFSS